jgi:hypothetical protein
LTDIKGDIAELKTDVNAIKDATGPEPAERRLMTKRDEFWYRA